jgi:hypothetical protein
VASANVNDLRERMASASNNMIWTQLQLQRWMGTGWEQFGKISRLQAPSNRPDGPDKPGIDELAFTKPA